MAAPKGHLKYDGKTINEDELKRLARLHLTGLEMAQWFQCSPELLQRDPYLTIIQQGRSETKQRLKQKAMQRATEEDSDVMLKFCLKNYCGWSENDNQTVSISKDDGEGAGGGFTINVIPNKTEPKTE